MTAAKQEESSNLKILICSAKAAGEGIDLTAASDVILFLLDWNPAMELQVIARVDRIGNLHTVRAYRLITTDSLDVRVKHKQTMKMEKASHFDGTYDYTCYGVIPSVAEFAEAVSPFPLHLLMAP